MTLIFLSIGAPEFLIIVVAIISIIAIGNYGRNTPLGYTGSVLLSIFTSPLIAFVVAYYLKYRASNSNS